MINCECDSSHSGGPQDVMEDHQWVFFLSILHLNVIFQYWTSVWYLFCTQDVRWLLTLTWQHRSFLSDSWYQHLRAWTRCICGVKTWGHTNKSHMSFPPRPLCLIISRLWPQPSLSLSLSLLVFDSRPSQEQQYAQWMAACRLGSKGKTLADSSFQSEIQSIRSFLAMQKTNSGSHGNAPANDESINTNSLVSPRYNKKYKTKQVPKRWKKKNKYSKCFI